MKQDTNPELANRYPREVRIGDSSVTLRYMTDKDREAALAFARALPAHDLLFLRRDITRPEAIDYWLNQIERGRIVSLLAETAGKPVFGGEMMKKSGQQAAASSATAAVLRASVLGAACSSTFMESSLL